VHRALIPAVPEPDPRQQGRAPSAEHVTVPPEQQTAGKSAAVAHETRVLLIRCLVNKLISPASPPQLDRVACTL
jgi:hypothetical protein